MCFSVNNDIVKYPLHLELAVVLNYTEGFLNIEPGLYFLDKPHLALMYYHFHILLGPVC